MGVLRPPSALSVCSEGGKSSREQDGSRLLSQVGFNLSLLIINSGSRLVCRDLDLPPFSGSGCPSASPLKYLMFDVGAQISVPQVSQWG